MSSDVARLSADDARIREASEPFAVIAVASLNRMLEDADALAEAVGQPNYAKFLRGFLSGMNDLRGFDRDRPLGSLMYFQPDDPDEVMPTFFFPTTDIEELLKTVRFGDSLRLKRDMTTGELTLQTEDDKLPVLIEHGYAFLSKERSVLDSEQTTLDPTALLGDSLDSYDLFVMLRRAGISQSLFDQAQRDIQADADEDLLRKPDESDVDFELRCDISRHVFGLVSSAVDEWQATSAGLNFAADTGHLNLDVEVEVEQAGEWNQLLSELEGQGTRFQRIIDEPAPLTVATSFALPSGAQEVIQRLLTSIRESVEGELHQVDDPVREAVFGLIDAVEQTVGNGSVDVYGQLVAQADNQFVLTGGIAIDSADAVADGLQQVLPFVVEAKEIREVELNVATAHGIAIHQLRPTKVRHRDRRLYGEDAAIYLAAGRGVFWIAVGDEQAIPALESAIERVSESTEEAVIEQQSSEFTSTDGSTQPLLSVVINLSQWTGFVESQEGRKTAKLASLAREAFSDSTGDTARLVVHTTPTGLKVRVDFAEGYTRLLGLFISRRIQSADH